MAREIRPVVVRRRNKGEVEVAIKDLEKRGFELLHPLTKFPNGCWFAKLKENIK
ncbi:hypothetical protein [Peribacillus frigoritolerans]|uniref:hypothetical protein n=1 Tax=Peribacillus frigoritolerans TaxID=450367 RepID=UPI002161F73F|nr:hypothetical protein [Peribacillus frigoritolerans]